MKLIKRILFPVDFSESCLSAARYVEAMAGRFEAEVMLLHVVGPGEGGLTLAEELLPLRKSELNAYLAEEFKYFTTQRVCVVGEDPADQIVAIAREWQADLVMMPTHGLGPFRRLLLGSATARVLKDLDCPVWTSVHSEAVLPLEDIHCRRVLVALDLAERSEYVLEWSTAFATENDASLGIVHATAMMPQLVTSVGLAEDLGATIAANARKEIDRLRFTSGINAPVFIEAGDPATVIAEAGKEFGADLLIMGRHQSGPEDGFAILRASQCPVITI
jgi:nucleotide-binding universal stress UspA family protein